MLGPEGPETPIPTALYASRRPYGKGNLSIDCKGDVAKGGQRSMDYGINIYNKMYLIELGPRSDGRKRDGAGTDFCRTER